MIDDSSKDYVLRKEKDLRKNLLGRKLGRLTFSADQPQALQITPNCPCSCPASTTVQVALSFVPNSPDTPPPELVSLTAKLVTSTFFSTVRAAYIPTLSRSAADPTTGVYTENTLLSSRCIGNVKWEPSSLAGKQTYHATLIVPVTAPKGKHLTPSFSSCFASRSYLLALSLSARPSTSLTLKLPLQVSQPAVAFVPAVDVGIDEFFTPRFVTPTSDIAQDVSFLRFGAGAEPPAFEEGRGVQLPRSMLVHPPNVVQAVTVAMGPPGYSLFGSAARMPERIPEPMGISPGCG